MVVILCSRHPQAGYERRFYTPHRSRLVGVRQYYENFWFRNICLPIYHTTVCRHRQAPKWGHDAK
jgi:hypothetical protein